MTDRDAVLSQLRSELDGLNTRLLEKDVILSELSRSLESSLSAVTDRDAVLSQLRSELEGMNTRLLKTSSELSQKDKLIVQYVNSWSWKFTSPLRWLAGFYMKLTR